MSRLLNWIRRLFVKAVVVVPPPVVVPEVSIREKVLEAAEKYLNTDPTPANEVPNEVACVSNLCTILRKVMPDIPKLTYTPHLVTFLKSDERFVGTLDLDEGNIIVNATGTGNGTIRGHTGIIGKGGKIMSGNSFNGNWEYNYTIDRWIKRYRTQGGMPTLVFRIVG